LAVGFCVFGHGNEDGNQFVGFLPDRIDERAAYFAIVAQEFQPELTLLGFLDAGFDFYNKLFRASGAGGFPLLGRNGCARANQLLAQNGNFIPAPVELDKNVHDAPRKLFSPLPKLYFPLFSIHAVFPFSFFFGFFLFFSNLNNLSFQASGFVFPSCRKEISGLLTGAEFAVGAVAEPTSGELVEAVVQDFAEQ